MFSRGLFIAIIILMRRIVLIDGENLVYALRTLLAKDTEKTKREAIDSFNFRGLIEEILADNVPTEILWFGAKLKAYANTEELRLKSESAIRQQAKFVNLIQLQKITFIKSGYLRARETDPCPKCGSQDWRLTEKGVDVGLAVRMISEADTETELVVISADTDLLPAFKASARMGSKIMHIGYEFRSVSALITASDTYRVITLPLAQKHLHSK
jgi:uncharacterized LabA/DUF88 family protein